MKKLILLFVSALLFVNVNSQEVKQKIELPASAEAFLPKVLMDRPLIESELDNIADKNYGQEVKVVEKKFWNVYSDREDNIAYKEPKLSSAVNAQLEFNKKLRIAQIKNGFALVYSEPDKTILYPGISQDAKTKGAYGWVPMSKLLLWSSCPANNHGILNKALIVQNLNKSATRKETIGKLFMNPENQGDHKDLVSDVRFYYVMKKLPNKNLVLLASESNLDGMVSNVLYGWVDESSYTPWSQRSCLEYNWDNTDIEQHLKNQTVRFYQKATCSEQDVASKGYTFEAKKNKGSYRIPGGRLRMPLLDNDSGNDKVYKCTFFGTPDGKMTQNEAEEVTAKFKKRKEQEILNKNTVNMIVVIDGTQSMEAYFKPLHEAIQNGFKYIGKQVDFKVGLVIYRDFADGKHVLDYVPVTSMDNPRLVDYMKTGGKYGIQSAPGDDYPEALYYGLNMALNTDSMKYKKEESNFIVVVGDCGNHPDGSPKAAKAPTQEDLMVKLKDNNASIISFQVHHKDKNEYWDLFTEQMTDIVYNNVKSRFEDIKNSTGEFVPSSENDGYDFKVKEGRQLFVASIRNPLTNQSMKPEVLSGLIQDGIRNFSGAVEQQKEAIVSGFDARTATEIDNGDQFDANYLKNILGEEQYMQMLAAKTVCALTGYTPKQTTAGHDYYKSVIFISVHEFQQMMDYFAKVYTASRNVENRQPYINAMKQLLNTMVPDMSPEEMEATSNKDITNMIAGLNAATESQKGYTMEQLADPLQVDGNTFRKLLNDFRKKYTELQNILDEGYNYEFKSNEDVYYWIPIELLP